MQTKRTRGVISTWTEYTFNYTRCYFFPSYVDWSHSPVIRGALIPDGLKDSGLLSSVSTALFASWIKNYRHQGTEITPLLLFMRSDELWLIPGEVKQPQSTPCYPAVEGLTNQRSTTIMCTQPRLQPPDHHRPGQCSQTLGFRWDTVKITCCLVSLFRQQNWNK